MWPQKQNCLHCGKRRKVHARGICKSCWNNASTRRLYPPLVDTRVAAAVLDRTQLRLLLPDWCEHGKRDGECVWCEQKQRRQLAEQLDKEQRSLS